jgi:hypothetical protein
VRFCAVIMHRMEGWPAWLDLMKEGRLVEVSVRPDDIGELLRSGDGRLQDPGCSLIAGRVRVFVPEEEDR